MPAYLYEGEGGRNLVLSALAQPRQTFFGQFLYRTIYENGAALPWSIVKNHGFINGNKRMGYATVSIFFVLNGYVLYAPTDRVVTLTVGIAEGTITQHEVALWLRRQAISSQNLAEILKGQTKEPVQFAEAAVQQLAALVNVMLDAVKMQSETTSSRKKSGLQPSG